MASHDCMQTAGMWVDGQKGVQATRLQQAQCPATALTTDVPKDDGRRPSHEQRGYEPPRPGCAELHTVRAQLWLAKGRPLAPSIA